MILAKSVYGDERLDSSCEGDQRGHTRLLTPKDIDAEFQQEAKAYARLKHRLLLVDICVGGSFALIVVQSGMSSWLKMVIAGQAPQPVVVGAYFVLFSVAYGVLLLPVEYYGGFVLPHRYGLSTETLKGWAKDQVKGGLLALGLGLIIVEVIYYLLGVLPSLWWFVTGLFMLVFTVVLANVAPVLLVPLFYRLTPLDDEELVERVVKLARRANTKVRGVFSINLSSKTKAANAMVMGLGNTRRIVLGDTLYSEYTADEVEAVLAHELGHHVHMDMWWGLLFQSMLTLMGLYLAHLGLSWGVRVMGFSGVNDVAALPLLGLVMGGFMVVTTPVSNAFSRWREGMADEYALRITADAEAFISVMVRLANQNLADVDPEPWVEFLLYSHPPIRRRIEHGQAFARQEMERGGAKA